MVCVCECVCGCVCVCVCVRAREREREKNQKDREERDWSSEFINYKHCFLTDAVENAKVCCHTHALSCICFKL